MAILPADCHVQVKEASIVSLSTESLTARFHESTWAITRPSGQGCLFSQHWGRLVELVFTCGVSNHWTTANFYERSLTWWRHQMETFSALLALCARNSLVIGEFPSQRPVTQSFDALYYLRLNKRLGIQSWGWWFETPSRSLWRQRNGFREQANIWYANVF